MREARRSPAAFSERAARAANLRPFDERPAPWLTSVVDRLNELGQVHGIVFAPAALRAALEVLVDPIWAGAPEPMLGPAEGSGVAIEFRGDFAEMQIEFDADGRGGAYVSLGTHFEWEGSLSDLPDGIDKWAWRLAQNGG